MLYLIRIKVNAPYIGNEELRLVSEVLRSGYLTSGPKVKQFEEEFSRYLGVRYVVTVSNGTIALYAILKSLGIGPGDEVIVPDFTFVATASMVLAVGAKPVFADIDLETYTIDPSDIERRVSRRTKAVIAVHLYGHPAHMDEILSIARSHGLYVIEDCAQAHGAEYRGVKVGSIGIANAFSFYATKNLTMGEGGAVTTNDTSIASKVKLMRDHGQKYKYYHIELGWNFRLTDMQAAIGIAQLRKLDEMNERRRYIAKLYNEGLSSIKEIRLPIEKSWARHVYHQYVIWVEDPRVRDKLAKYLNERGIQTAIHYPLPLHEQPVFLNVSKGVYCPRAEEASRHVLSLPMHPGLTDEDVEYVVKEVRRFFSSLK